jgi:hypothetical protein
MSQTLAEPKFRPGCCGAAETATSAVGVGGYRNP